ncbi:MAG: crossover junction endodeoxyribonuclease RuvC [Pseudomonadota bacterium]|nr:crossover junction endodeoxyribonuclease RuvC [Pseudomonadota bacterium]
MTVILGIDPGLQRTGWGIIASKANQLSFIACGTVHTDASLTMAERLRQLHDGLQEPVARYRPEEAAVEETFINKSGSSSLKLGQARGAVMLALSLSGLPVYEYGANVVKKSVVGAGHADKNQIAMMVKTLLPASNAKQADAADALAVAICHAHHRQLQLAVAGVF